LRWSHCLRSGWSIRSGTALAFQDKARVKANSAA
jgi:hypothetical protein